MRSLKLLPKLKKPELFLLRRIVGRSMLPALAPGAIVVGLRARRVVPGDVVVVRHKGLEKLKRVKAVRGGEVFLIGDNPAESSDSRDFGWLEARLVIAKVVWPKLKRTNN